jgi:hypothetical protein
MRRFLTSDSIESIAAFFTGGIPASILSFSLFDGVIFPMMLAALTGIVGGCFALLGKDIYKWIKSKFIK